MCIRDSMYWIHKDPDSDSWWNPCQPAQKVFTACQRSPQNHRGSSQGTASSSVGWNSTQKLAQDWFLEQLNSLELIDQLVPLHSAWEYLPCNIINILELLGKADNIPFNQLYTLTENCADRYYTYVIKTLTQLLKQSFTDRQTVLVNSACALKFLES